MQKGKVGVDRGVCGVEGMLNSGTKVLNRTKNPLTIC